MPAWMDETIPGLELGDAHLALGPGPGEPWIIAHEGLMHDGGAGFVAVVDQVPDEDVWGDAPAVALDPTTGVLRIAYIGTDDSAEGYSLWIAELGTTGWTHVQAVTGASEFDFAITPDGVGHALVLAGGELGHWSDASGGWSLVEIVDPAGSRPSLVVDTAGEIHASYRNNALAYAHWDGLSWTATSLGTANVYGSAIAVDSLDRPRIAAYLQADDIVYAEWDGIGWTTSVPLAADSYSAYGIGLALDADDRPTIAWCDYLPAAIQEASWDGASWVQRVVRSGSRASGRMTVAFDAEGVGHIFAYDYRSAYNRAMSHFQQWPSGAWFIDERFDDGYGSSAGRMVLDDLGFPHLAMRLDAYRWGSRPDALGYAWFY